MTVSVIKDSFLMLKMIKFRNNANGYVRLITSEIKLFPFLFCSFFTEWGITVFGTEMKRKKACA